MGFLWYVFSRIRTECGEIRSISTPIACSYSDIAIIHLDKIINEKRTTQFQECFYFGRYCGDCLVLWCGDIEKLNDFQKMLNTLE